MEPKNIVPLKKNFRRNPAFHRNEVRVFGCIFWVILVLAVALCLAYPPDTFWPYAIFAIVEGGILWQRNNHKILAEGKKLI